ncbi:AraC family transcriptional regulator [Agarilytica rhodophyticola]|uniref:AraC family transcriptional regulator n=1 Tax=Agarilytica rhodophyticola TaxID=1737490 RepID=UPI000B3470EA|nr:AraC family transcriptional regulator [Agarilytica rhodophyticola]
MDMSLKVIPLQLHPLGFIESFTHFGASLNSLLKETGINKNMLAKRGIKISYSQLNRLIKNGIKECQLPGIGLLIGGHIDWSYHGTVGTVVYCSPSLKDAFHAYFHFLTLAQPYYEQHLQERRYFYDTSKTIVDPILTFGPTENDRELYKFEIEFQLAITLRLIDLCGNKSVSDTRIHVCLEYEEPEYIHLYKKLPCTSLRFGCKHSSISASEEFIVQPWRELRRPTFLRVIQQCEEELQNSGMKVRFATKVCRIIAANYFNYHNSVTVESVAEHLNITPRSLTRRLAHEQTSFRQLYHEVRMDMASRHLKSSHLSTEEIANLMGFSSVSSLRRSIKNWSGTVISSIRDKSVNLTKKACPM